MRYGPALAVIIAALTLAAVFPMAVSSDSDAASTYYGEDKINICGYVTGYDSTMAAPNIYVFIVHKEIESEKELYKYTNLDDDPNETPLISATIDSNNKFSVVVPKINNTIADYYFCFDIYSIKNLPWYTEKHTIIPDSTLPSSMEGKDYLAYKIPRPESGWASVTPCNPYNLNPSTEYWMTADDPTDPWVIGLSRSMGKVTGHVSNIVRGEPTDLGGVLVEFFNSDGKRAAYTTTDKDGDYEVEVPTGDYNVEFYRGNFRHETIQVNVIEGNNRATEVTMEYEMENVYFGYDLTHFLMFVGAGICIFLIITSLGFQYRRIKKNKSGNEWILDDMPEEKDE